MANTFNLRKLDPTHVTVQGREYAIEDHETGKVLVTCKSYIDKLFKEMGYRNLGVIKILEDFAGKFISDVGSLSNSCIYVDDTSDIFIVTSEKALSWIDKMYEELKLHNCVVEDKIADDYHGWDQVLIKSPTGTRFAIYIDLVDEYVHVLSLDYDKDNNLLKGIINEGKYLFGEEGSLDSLMVLIDNPINASAQINPSMNLSYEEYLSLLSTLGLVKKKRGKYSITDEGESEINGLQISDTVLDIIEDYNIKTWIQRRITSPKVTFEEACYLMSKYLDHVKFWYLKDFFEKNSKEESDLFLV